jgi:hypothetical protein
VLQTLLFFHILGVIGLFAGITIEIAALVRVHRASTLAEVRAAVLNVPAVGPIMGISSLLLIGMGIAMIYAGGFGWTAGWINVVFVLTLILAVLGPTVSGRKGDALHAMAAQAGEGAVTPQIDAARRDRVFNYMVFMSVFELIAALYIMVVKPELVSAVIVAIAAAVLAFIPATLAVRRTAPARSAET